MSEKMIIDKIQHKGPVTYITTKSLDGQVTRHMICWWAPRTKPLLKSLKNGDTLITVPIAKPTK
jgi:hypothetical protein